MKVLFLITSLAFGGAETQLVRLATRLKARGWDIHVVSLTPSTGLGFGGARSRLCAPNYRDENTGDCKKQTFELSAELEG